MEFAYIITLAALLVCFLAALVGLRLAASNLSSPVPGSSWRCDAFLPVLLVSFAAFVLLFAFANRTYDQIFPLTWEFKFIRDVVFRGAGFMDCAVTIGQFLLYLSIVAVLFLWKFHKEQKKLADREKDMPLVTEI